MSYQQIRYEVTRGVAVVTLDRPEKLNAYTPQMGSEIRHAAYAASDDDEVRIIVITGAGRGFCAGADMKLLQSFSAAGRLPSADDEGTREPIEPIRRVEGVREDFLTEYTYLMSLPKPVIAAVNGAAAGVGFVLALAADMRFASQSAKLGAVFSKRGLIAEYGVSWLLPRLVGPAHAADILFSGKVVSGDEAARIGLVNDTFPDDGFVDAVVEYAVSIAETASPRSLRVMKRQLWDDQFNTLAESVDVAVDEMRKSLKSEDFKEGVAHFVEKRAPRFSGR
ncbi:MAG: enoyl-CoA hydratase/carnithine racemase [Hyphomicrobiaceae bacterium]